MNRGIDYKSLEDTLARASSDGELFQSIVNAPFDFPLEAAQLFLGIIVLLLVDKKSEEVHRIALSQTELARRTTDVSSKPFHDIIIPLSDPDNIIAHAIKTKSPQETTDWKFLFTPSMREEAARINQANAGIAYSAVHPLKARDGGAMIFSYYQYKHGIGDPQHVFMERYSALVDAALGR